MRSRPFVSSLSSLAFVAASTASAVAATGSTCGIAQPVASSSKCHEPRDCGSGATIDVGKFTIGLGGSSGTASEACCRILEYIPAHNEKGAKPEYKLIQSSKEGWTKTGQCMPAAISILGVISIPLGERYCDYGVPHPTSIDHYEADGYCSGNPRT